MDNKRMINCGYLLCLLGLALATVCHAVTITNFKVPSAHILHKTDEPPASLILDCEYEIASNETVGSGLVVKWLFNNQVIYQWTPPKLPFSLPMSPLKNFTNTSYAVSDDPLQKYRALVIENPTVNMTGTYGCKVDTYKSEDKRSAHVQIIVPESELKLRIQEDDDDNVKIDCRAKDIFPEPILKLSISNNESHPNFVTKKTKDDIDGLYDISIFGQIKRDLFDDPSDIECTLQIAGTSYLQSTKASQFSHSSTLVPAAHTLLLSTLLISLILLHTSTSTILSLFV